MGRPSKPNRLRDCVACGKPFKARGRANLFCSRETCRKARRLSYMRDYMKRWKKKHPGYWKTDKQRDYLRRWRAAHPTYFRDWRQKQKRARRISVG